MSDSKNREFPTEWLNLLRFLAVFFIVWSHFDNRIFAETHPQGLNIQRMFFFPPSAWSRILYGYTGKYAVAMLCVISGFVTAWVCRHKRTGSFRQFFVKRYLRLILPVFGMSVLYLTVSILSGDCSWSLYEAVSGLFILGSDSFSGYNWCLPAFFTGNVLIWLLSRWDERDEKAGPVLKLAILSVGLLCCFLVAYKIYNSWLFWTASVLAGFLVYEFYTQISIKLSWYMAVILVLAVYWLPRGEESMKIYMRCTAASGIVVYVVLHMERFVDKISGFCRKKKASFILAYSYSLFIVHGFTMSLFSEQIISRVYAWTDCWWLTYAITFVLKLIFDFSLSFVIYYFFENRVYRLCCRYIDGKL